MSEAPKIVVERGIEVGETTFGCVRKDNKPETGWSFIPTGAYTERAFRSTCRIFDESKEVTTVEDIVPEGAANAGEVVHRLGITWKGVAELGRLAEQFANKTPRGYQPLEK